MRVSRLMSGSLSILVSVAMFEIVGCSKSQTQPGGVPQVAHYKNVKCEKDVTVTLDPKKHGVDKEAIYICEDEPYVTWTPDSTVTTFSLDFGANCPFSPCQITETSRTGHIPGPISTQPLTVYPYTVTINQQAVASDPQVVGGGGHNSAK